MKARVDMKAVFKCLMTQNAMINKYMRIADLFQDDEGIYAWYRITIRFKNGVIVDAEKIEATKINIKKAIEEAGGELSLIEFVGFESEG